MAKNKMLHPKGASFKTHSSAGVGSPNTSSSTRNPGGNKLPHSGGIVKPSDHVKLSSAYGYLGHFRNPKFLNAGHNTVPYGPDAGIPPPAAYVGDAGIKEGNDKLYGQAGPPVPAIENPPMTPPPVPATTVPVGSVPGGVTSGRRLGLNLGISDPSVRAGFRNAAASGGLDSFVGTQLTPQQQAKFSRRLTQSGPRGRLARKFMGI